jgi:hypothetical protein
MNCPTVARGTGRHRPVLDRRLLSMEPQRSPDLVRQRLLAAVGLRPRGLRLVAKAITPRGASERPKGSLDAGVGDRM